ncbi:hypothetical protein [Humibacillus sp. DSM 29435]|uniref:hypothetical protein n=1 Tax=Humibacillus sp. DSM 29435 TaxID=1869167 RepID=UPI0011131A71|nr:hypothetical protein [Humibacillus sp. DSM 29435]
MDTVTRQPTAGTYLNLGLLAFAVVGWELVLLLLESFLPALTLVGSLSAAVVHWALTGAGWLVGSAIVLRAARRREGFIADPPSPARRLERVVAVFALVVLCVGLRWVGQGSPFPPVAEYGRMIEQYADLAWVALVVQWLYYAAEVVVMTLIIAFGQRAGELRFGCPALPWGGFLLALTWGLVHVLLQGVAAGLYGMLISVAFGMIFVLTGRSVRRSSAPLVVAFIL